MLKHLTRSKVILVWFASVALLVLVAVALGVEVIRSTAVMLLAVGLVPPAILLMLWPRTQSLTAADVLHGGDRRT